MNKRLYLIIVLISIVSLCVNSSIVYAKPDNQISEEEILDSERCLNIKKGFENNIAYEELCQKCSYKLKFK